MTEIEVLIDLFGRIDEHVHEAVDGLGVDELHAAPDDGSNTIGWLVWHLARGQDHQVAEALGRPQVWADDQWPPRFGCAPGYKGTGYGHSLEDMLSIRPESADALIEYYDAVAAQTMVLLGSLDAAALGRIVDEHFDPPVTLGVRLISIADDDIQHAGQATYVRGLLKRRRASQR